MSDPIEKSLFSFRGGIQNKRANPLDMPEDALAGGLNVDLSDGAIRTRPGYSIVSDDSLPAGEVMAIAQVRFPSNETSFLVAQVANAGPVYVPPDEEESPINYGWPHICYDESRNRIWAFWNYSGNPTYYDVDTKTWYEITNATNAGTNIWGEVVYDPTRDLVWGVGEKVETEEGTIIAIAQVWSYDPELNAFEDRGESLDFPNWALDRPHGHGLAYDQTNDRLVMVCGSSADGGSVTYLSLDYLFTLSLPTLTDAKVACTGSPGSIAHCAFAFDSQNMRIMIAGGVRATVPGGAVVEGLKEAWILDLSTYTWEQAPDVPVAEPPTEPTGLGNADAPFLSSSQLTPETSDWLSCATLVFCNGRFVITGNAHSFELESLAETAYSWASGETEWTPFPIQGNPVPRIAPGLIVESSLYLVLGYYLDDAQGWPPAEMPGVQILSDLCNTVVIGGGSGDLPVTSRLYASNDHLPTTTATFTQIYDLGEADRVSFAVLNDRVVMTEGKAAPPLVWGGCMEADASDWMYPKAVLVTQDGSNFYDISAKVLDKDVDNVAGIGDISSSGFIAVGCDMPTVEGFYFEMETPNAVGSDVEATTYRARTLFDELADFTQADFKATIHHWVQDSGAYGHFENVSNVAVTLGPGNTCPEVIPGVVVNFAAGDRVILAITGDGSGSSAVILDDTQTGATVPSISGLVMSEDDTVCVKIGHSADTSVWSASAGTSARYGGYSIRQVISGSDIAAAGDTIRLTMRSGSGFTAPANGYWWLQKAEGSYYGQDHMPPIAISNISIVERDGETANGATAPTPITFPKGNLLAGSRYCFNNGFEVTAGSSGYLKATSVRLSPARYTAFNSEQVDTQLQSNAMPFAVDPAKDYLLIMDIVDTWFQPQPAVLTPVWDGTVYRQQYVWEAKQRGGALNLTSGAGFYYKYDPDEEVETYNQQTVTGFSFQAGYSLGLVDITTQIPFPVPDQIVVGHTTDTTHFDTSAVEDFRNVTIEQEVPSGTAIYWAISLDGRATFQVFRADAWTTVVRESGGAWQYLDATETWQNAAYDTLLQALKEAFAVSGNSMTAEEIAALTPAQWKGTGGIQLRVTTSLDVAFGLLPSETVTPTITAYTVAYNDAGSTTITGWQDGGWTRGDGWTDNTLLEYVPWGQSGTVMYNGTSGFDAGYSVLNEVPGFWFRFMCNGTSSAATITRILYKAPCQPLANLGDGQSDIPLAMIFHDTSKDSKKDITIEVSGGQGSFTTDEDGDIGYTAGKATIPMQAADYLYVGYLLRFGEIEVTPYHDYENTAAAVLSAEYWTGKAWAEIEIVDNTVGTGGNTLATEGKISWVAPDDWKMHIPLGADFPRGYYIRFKVSATITTTTAIDEVRVYAVPDDLVKHKFAVSFRDRIALVSRPDAPDQVDISRALEEYGFIGADSGSYRVGGMDSIQCAISAWNGLMLGKTESLHQLQGQTPSDFQWEGVEAARSVPINGRSCIKAPASGFGGDGNRYGLFFINQFGAFCATGLQVDGTFNTSRGQTLSELTNWWTTDAVPRLARNNLYIACGEYWPVRNWLVWSVPMLLTSGQTSQTTNNRLIVYDLSLSAWLPPMDIPVASLCLAYDYVEGSPGHIGPAALLAGDYQGRILRLFEATTDNGTDIAWSVETGWLSFASPDWEKQVRWVREYGSNENDMTFTVYADGNTTTPVYTGTVSALTSPTGFFTIECADQNAHGNFLKFVLSGMGVSSIFGLQMSLLPVRQVPGGVA